MDLAMGEGGSGSRPSTVRPVPLVDELAPLFPDYEIQAIIGRGGMGAVYRAVQKKLARTVAIKVMPVELGDEPGFAERFRREAMTTAGLVHPDIVSVYDTGETVAGHLYYVMEFVEGEDLAHRMARGRLPVEEAIPLLAAVCGAVEAAHAQGIVHRDIKPSNILLTKEGRPRLADFGLALLTEKHLALSRLTMAVTTLGTIEYAAPEQLAGGQIGTASDLYSLGVLAYEVLTGELPRGIFDPPSVRNPEIDAAFDGVILRALQSDPARRYASASEFRSALLQAADRRLQHERRERELRRKVVRRARAAAVLTAITVLTGGSAIYAWWAKQEATQRRAAAVAAEAKTDGLIQFLLTDLRRRLEPTGNLGAMESVLERAVKHYREKYEAAGHSPEAAVQLADVLVAKADVIGVRGLGNEADVLYTEALALAQSARDASPQDLARGLRVAAALQDLSEHHMSSGRYPQALRDARRMLEEAAKAAAATTDPEPLRTMAAAHRAIANALGYLQQLDECRREYLESQRILAGLVRAHPSDASLAHELADLDMSLGSLAEEQKDYPKMLEHFTAWHAFIQQRYSRDDQMYSYSAFRMGVAMVKCGRPAEAVPFLTDAIRLADRQVAGLPGHKGALNHLAWCLRVMAEAHEATGDTVKAAEFRQRESATNAKQAALAPGEDSFPHEELSRLAGRETTHDEWWAFCQQLQAAAERELDPIARRTLYESWIKRAAAAAEARPAGDLTDTVEAFLQNRLAVEWLETDPALSAHHASKSLDLRQAMAEAHPGNPVLEVNVLSSAGHLVRAAVRANTAAEAAAALSRFTTAARKMSPPALVERDQALTFARDAATSIERAATRWPEARPELSKLGSEIAAQLLDRLPEDKKTSAAATLRDRLSLASAGR
jgi:tetratricopeptide (TPR) repeat protein